MVHVKARNAVTEIVMELDGRSVVIGGPNGAGKTGFLNAIRSAVKGAKFIGDDPVHDGAKKAETILELDNGVIIRQTINRNGRPALTVRDENGIIKSPMTWLNDITGGSFFDIGEFPMKSPVEIGHAIRRVFGVDTSEIDARRQKYYDERTLVNRDGKALKARLTAMPPIVEGVPDEPVSMTELTERYSKANEQNTSNNAARRCLAEMRASQDIIKTSLEKMRSDLKIAEDNYAETCAQIAFSEKDVAALEDIDLEGIRDGIANVEQTNADIRANNERREAETQLKAKAKESRALTSAIEQTEREKAAATASVFGAIPGLTFDEDGLPLYNNRSYPSLASSGERLIVAAYVGIAQLPKDGLRVLLCHEAGIIDNDNWNMLANVAETEDVQLLAARPWEEGADYVIHNGALADDTEVGNMEFGGAKANTMLDDDEPADLEILRDADGEVDLDDGDKGMLSAALEDDAADWL